MVDTPHGLGARLMCTQLIRGVNGSWLTPRMDLVSVERTPSPCGVCVSTSVYVVLCFSFQFPSLPFPNKIYSHVPICKGPLSFVMYLTFVANEVGLDPRLCSFNNTF